LECVDTAPNAHVCDLDAKQTLILLASTLTSVLMFGHKLTYVELLRASLQLNTEQHDATQYFMLPSDLCFNTLQQQVRGANPH
jgi:hypothetical protein